MSKADAFRLLRDTSWFAGASDDFVAALADKMVLVEAEVGHLFVEEGEDLVYILIIERGKLARSKSTAASTPPAANNDNLRSSLRQMSHGHRLSSLETEAIVVDEVKGRGRVTGLLHNMQDHAQAFATVTVADGPAKVWQLPGHDFRSIVSSQPAFALEMMQVMSQELRMGSKNLRALLKRTQPGGQASMKGSGQDGGKALRVMCYDATSWVKEGFAPAVEAYNNNNTPHDLQYRINMDYTTERLSTQSAPHAAGYDAVCLFVNDAASADILQTLSLLGVHMIAMRCAGFDRVDMQAARVYGFTVARVPAYSPYAVAEHAMTLCMAVNRKIAKASSRVKMANFTLDAGLMGMDLYGKTIGVMGTGKIGRCLCNIVLGFGARLLCYDVYENDTIKQKGGIYVSKEEIFAQSDVLFLMMPLVESTKHVINDDALDQLKPGVLLINTSRGGLIDTKALRRGLKRGIIGGVGMDVYEHEQEYFFQDWSARHIADNDLVALLGDHHVILTAHQAFFTKEAVDKIVSTTIDNLDAFAKGQTGLEHPNNCIPV